MLVYGKTNRGKIRDTNQDGIFLAGNFCTGNNSEIRVSVSSPALIYVADGVGGVQDGAFAVHGMGAFSLRVDCPQSESDLRQYLYQMNDFICSRAVSAQVETASTIAGLMVCRRAIYSFNIGDSAVFSFNKGFLQKLSVDDTVYGLTDSVPEDEAFKAPLLQYIGKPRMETDCHIHEAIGGDKFLICSDGLTDMVDIDDMEDIMNSTDENKAIVDMLFAKAMENGGKDNISIAYVQI